MGSPRSLSNHQVEAGTRPSPLCLGWTRYVSIGNGLQTSRLCTRYRSFSHCQRSPTHCPSHTTVNCIQLCGASLVLCSLPNCLSGDSEILLALFCCFCGFSHPDLDPFAHIITPLSLWLVSRCSVQLLIVDFCICFCHLLHEGSMMTIEGDLNLIAGEASSGTSSTIAWHLIWGHPYRFGQILSARFLDHPVMSPSFKIFLSLLSFTDLPRSWPSHFLMLSSPLPFSPLLSISTPNHAQVYSGDLVYFPFLGRSICLLRVYFVM